MHAALCCALLAAVTAPTAQMQQILRQYEALRAQYSRYLVTQPPSSWVEPRQAMAMIDGILRFAAAEQPLEAAAWRVMMQTRRPADFAALMYIRLMTTAQLVTAQGVWLSVLGMYGTAARALEYASTLLDLARAYRDLSHALD